jgi:hypothetical protein
MVGLVADVSHRQVVWNETSIQISRWYRRLKIDAAGDHYWDLYKSGLYFVVERNYLMFEGIARQEQQDRGLLRRFRRHWIAAAVVRCCQGCEPC